MIWHNFSFFVKEMWAVLVRLLAVKILWDLFSCFIARQVKIVSPVSSTMSQQTEKC